MNDTPYSNEAGDFLQEAADAIKDRAASRDIEAERSMAATVALFGALTNAPPMPESDGWLFMVCLKMTRAKAGAYRRDDYVDAAAYLALAGEAAAKADKVSEQWVTGVVKIDVPDGEIPLPVIEEKEDS